MDEKSANYYAAKTLAETRISFRISAESRRIAIKVSSGDWKALLDAMKKHQVPSVDIYGNYEISGDQVAQPGICPVYTVFLPPQEEGKEGN